MYAVELKPGALRALRETLPSAVSFAVAEMLDGPLRTIPRVVGKPLNDPLGSLWVLRREAYRVLYDINDEAMVVTVIRIAHRRDAYRRLD
ncbi:MAG: type II toxin-antitoxin system RelE/ParE family toxin [Actinobacteria bacterium]|nr:type II toxin-antitoxin system RelE/ParE family toxin [Actinomycetota bacterium]